MNKKRLKLFLRKLKTQRDNRIPLGKKAHEEKKYKLAGIVMLNLNLVSKEIELTEKLIELEKQKGIYKLDFPEIYIDKEDKFLENSHSTVKTMGDQTNGNKKATQKSKKSYGRI